MAKIKVNLSLKSIQQAIDKLDKLQKNLPRTADRMAKAAAKQAKDIAETTYSGLPYKNVSSNVTFKLVKIDKGYRVLATGESVVYDEFGTGTEGTMHPHPEKGKYSLNPYNSGSTIRVASDTTAMYSGIPAGELYWTFKDKTGVIHYTQGVPAGKFMYEAQKWLDEHYKEIGNKEVGEDISKL